jgi:hypothetical protein
MQPDIAGENNLKMGDAAVAVLDTNKNLCYDAHG